MNTESKTETPFPLNHFRYNKVIINKGLTVFVPYSNRFPFVFIENINNKEREAFLYVDNLEKVTSEVLYSVNCFDDYENIVDVADFSSLESKINLIVLEENYSQTYYYKKYNGHNKLFRAYKSKIENEKHNPFWVLELDNHNKYMPIEKRIIDGKTIESYFHMDIENNKLYHSFDLKSDQPFQITTYQDGNDFYNEKDYLIPFVKKNRNDFYKPTFVKTKNNKIIDYEYFINGVDYTNVVKEAFIQLNINDPTKHKFSERDKTYLKNKLTKESL